MKKILIAFYGVLIFSCTPNHTAKDFIGEWVKENGKPYTLEIEYIAEKGFQVTENHSDDNSFNLTFSPPNYKLVNGKLVSGKTTIFIENGKLIFQGKSFKKL